MIRPTHQPGHTLVLILTVLGVMLLLAMAGLTLVETGNAVVHRSYESKQALNLAEAGIDRAIQQLNTDPNYGGEANVPLGNGVFTIKITGSNSLRTIDSTGFLPNSASPRVKQRLEVDVALHADRAQFFYGIQVDNGGMIMGNNATLTGNIYSNGNIIANPGSKITGSAVVAGGISDDPQVAWITDNGGQIFANASSSRNITQSFTATASDRISQVSVLIAKVGTPNNLTLHLVADNNGLPATTDLASTTVAATDIGTTASWVNASFATTVNLVSGTKYWLILDYNTNNANNYFVWRKDTTDGYANNSGYYTNSWNTNPTWTAINADLDFKVWIGGTLTKIDGATIGDATSGTAQANSFVNTTVRGSPCVNANCTIANPVHKDLPISDNAFTQWRNAAAAGGTQVGDYILNGVSNSLGPKKIQGNLTVENNATLTITGTLWVTGNIIFSNNCTIRLDNAYGTNSGTIITDGTVSVDNNCALQGASQNSYVLIASTKNDPTGTGMTINNNSLGVIYYTQKSRISFGNNALAREVTAYGLDLANGAQVVYDTGLADISFTSGPGAGWLITPGTYRQLK